MHRKSITGKPVVAGRGAIKAERAISRASFCCRNSLVILEVLRLVPYASLKNLELLQFRALVTA